VVKNWIGWAAEALVPGGAMWVFASPDCGWHVHRAIVRSTMKPLQKLVVVGANKIFGDDELRPFAHVHTEAYLAFKDNGTLRLNPPPNRYRGDVWTFDSGSARINRVAEEAFRIAIQMCSNKGDVIMDPFMGRGSALKVGLELERSVVGFEQDPVLYRALTTLVT
jgi:hypothetical protein